MILGVFAQQDGTQITATSGISWATYDGSNNGAWTVIASGVYDVTERNGIINIGNTVAFFGDSAAGQTLFNFNISGNSIITPVTSQLINSINPFFQNSPQIVNNIVDPNTCLIAYENTKIRTAVFNGTDFTLGTETTYPSGTLRGTTLKSGVSADKFIFGVGGLIYIATVSGSSVTFSSQGTSITSSTFYDAEITPIAGSKGVEVYTINNHEAAFIARRTWPNTRAVLFQSGNGPQQAQEFLHVTKVNDGKYMTIYKSVNRYPILRTVYPDSDTLGTQVIVENLLVNDISYQQINSNWGILCYRINADIKSAIINTLSVDPQVINIFTDYTSINNNNSAYIAVKKIDETTLVQISLSPTSNLVARVVKL